MELIVGSNCVAEPANIFVCELLVLFTDIFECLDRLTRNFLRNLIVFKEKNITFKTATKTNHV